MKYIATKIVDAVKMHKSKARELGYKVPDDVEKANNDGYEVTYKNGYKSWCPSVVFESDYKPLEEQDECVFCKENVDVSIDVGFSLDKSNDLTFFADMSCDCANEFIEIDYCPFCGRKLH